MTPVRLVEPNTVPFDACFSEQLIETHDHIFAGKQVTSQSAINKVFAETVNIVMDGEQVPVKPAQLVVLAIGIIVAVLSPAHFVAHEQHGGAESEQRHRQEILQLPVSDAFDYRIITWTFDSAVPAQVVIAAITVVFPVGLIVLEIIGDEVIEGEAVMTGDEVDALLRFSLFVSENVRASQ